MGNQGGNVGDQSGNAGNLAGNVGNLAGNVGNINEIEKPKWRFYLIFFLLKLKKNRIVIKQ